MRRMTEKEQRLANGGGWLRDFLAWLFKRGREKGKGTLEKFGY